MPIGTTAALIGSAVVSGAVQAGAAKKAAKAIPDAAKADIAFQTETRDIRRNDLSLYREGGYTAQQALDYEMGLGAAPMIGGSAPSIESFYEASAAQPQGVMGRDGQGGRDGTVSGGQGVQKWRVNGQVFNSLAEAQAYANANRAGGKAYGGYTRAPGYDFRLKSGTDAIEAGAAARGKLYSGATMRDLLTYGQDYATSEYDNYMNRLAGRADAGMAAADMSGQASQQAAAGVSNAYKNIGNAKAAGAIGFGDALTGAIGNGVSAWEYMNNLKEEG